MNKKNSGAESYEKRILAHVCRQNYKPVKPKVIFKKLELDEDEMPLFKKALKKLIRENRLRWGAGHQVIDNEQGDRRKGPSRPSSPPDSEPPAEGNGPTDVPARQGAGPWWVPAQVQMGVWSSPNETAAGKKRGKKKDKAKKKGRAEESKRGGLQQMVGRFRRTASGHGTVTPTVLETTAAEVASQAFQTAPDERVFIRAPQSMDAASGDIVLVEYSRKRRGATSEWSGRVVEILRRRTNQFVGTYWVNQGAGCVTVDGGQFPQSVLVGDASAKGVQPDDKVVIEMVRFPSQHDYGQAVIVEVLGKFGQPNLDTLMIMRQFDLPEEFPEAVIEASRAQAAQFTNDIRDGRRDLTRETIITIDPFDARDFDDAISLRKIENDHWVLGVHIADVSHFVKPNTPLDDEAYKRGTSVYLPDKVVPMLPEIISNHLASLQPDQVRFAMTAEIELTNDGKIVSTEFFRSAIQSKRRFTYEEVDEFLENREGWRSKLTPEVFLLLSQMHELAMQLRQVRFANGSLEMMLPEVKLELDRQGQVAGAKVVENTESHQMIEEFMLIANVAVATQLTDLGYHVLRRIHSPPSSRRLSELTQFVQQLGIEVDSLENRFEIKRVLEETSTSPLRHAVHYAVLRSMQKAVYGPKAEGHFALSFQHYCHFTSPIRRYPDLVIHRMLGDVIDGKRPNDQVRWLTLVGEHCSDREQNAEQADRELIKLKLLAYCSDKVGQEVTGVITGVESFGLFVQGLEIPAEGLVMLANMPEDDYYFDDRSRLLMGRASRNQFRLGDQVLVRIHRVDLVRRQLDLVLVEHLTNSSPGSGKKRKRQTEPAAPNNKKGKKPRRRS